MFILIHIIKKYLHIYISLKYIQLIAKFLNYIIIFLYFFICDIVLIDHTNEIPTAEDRNTQKTMNNICIFTYSFPIMYFILLYRYRWIEYYGFNKSFDFIKLPKVLYFIFLFYVICAIIIKALSVSII